MKKGGSEIDSKSPYMRFEIVFPKAFKIHKLMKVISPPELLKWEKNMKFSDKELVGETSNIYFVHAGCKKNFGIAARDWYDKGIQFVHEGTIYKFVSSIADSEAKQPVPDKDTVRATHHFSMIKIHRSPTDGKIHYASIV